MGNQDSVVQVVEKPISCRPFAGVGVQADCFLADEHNRKAGVTDADLALCAARLQALRPGIVRVFLGLDDFNPAFDAATYDWTCDAFRRQRDWLQQLGALGAKVNICMSPWTNAQMRGDGAEAAAVDLLDHLVRQEGMDHIHWLTLFNEPDSLYAHDSPLYERLFGDRPDPGRRPWADYVAKHQRTQSLLVERGLTPGVKLVVADTVWGYAMRQERLRLCARDFAGLDVAYSCHNYIVDWPGFYDGSPDFASPGMAGEAEALREIVGAEAELVVWEFNNAGEGFGHAWPGMGPSGEDLLGSLENGVAVSRKILAALAHGMDGIALWCLHDMCYNWPPERGLMHFGLWRFRDEQWEPRPYYYYVGALMHALRPGASLYRVRGVQDGVTGLAARDAEGWSVVLLNGKAHALSFDLQLPAGATLRRQRVHPGVLPTPDRLPLVAWEALPAAAPRRALTLEPRELTVLRVT